MKTKIERCGIGGLKIIEASLDRHNKEIIDKFIITCGATAGKTTQAKIRSNLLKIWDILEVDLDKITLDILREFLNLIKDSDLMPPTKNELRKVIKRFLKEQYDDWSSRFKQLKDIKGEKEINVERVNADTIFTKNEIERLIRGCDSLAYKAIFMTMYELAGRPEEIEKLRWRDIKLDKGEVTLRSSKNGTLRINPIQNSIIHLKRYQQEYPYMDVCSDDYVFPSPQDRKKHISNIAVDIYFKKLGKRILGRDIFPYLLRHTRATELQKVLPAKVYEKFMDHSIETATRYSHLDKDDVRDAMFKNVYKVDHISSDEKDKLEKEVEQHQKDILALKEKINDITKFGTVVNDLFEDKELQRALLKSMIKNGLGKQLIQLSHN